MSSLLIGYVLHEGVVFRTSILFFFSLSNLVLSFVVMFWFLHLCEMECFLFYAFLVLQGLHVEFLAVFIDLFFVYGSNVHSTAWHYTCIEFV